MSRPYWVTKAGDLGTIPELQFYELPLQVVDPTNATVNFSFLSGELPPGIQVVKSGILQGVPVVTNPIAVDETRSYNFTVRATALQTGGNVVVDRSFSLTINNVYPPIITPRATDLGATFDGQEYVKQLQAIEENPAAVLEWKVTDGQLPPGLTLSSSGLISGYILLQPALYDTGTKGYDGDNITSQQPYDGFPYDYAGRARNKIYTFTVQVSDGANYDNFTYNLMVVAKGLYTADQDHIDNPTPYQDEAISLTVDNDYVTVDADNRYVPIITTPSQALPTIRQESNFAFQFEAIDFEGDDIGWTISLAEGSGFDQNGSRTFPEDSVRQVIWFDNSNEGTFDSNNGTVSFTVNTAPYSDDNNSYTPTVTVNGAVAWWGNTYMMALTEGSDFTISTNSIIVDANVANAIVSGSGRIGANIRIVPEANPELITGVGYDYALYDQSESKLPPVLEINSDTGWLYGTISPQEELEKTYSFIINAYKKDFPSYISDSITYNLTILGDTYDQINWVTQSNLGTIINGSVSELQVEAVSTLGKDIVYSLESAVFQHLPQGLQLLDNGLISGRCTFRHFTLDAGAITFDRNTTYFDNLYQFTVKATTVDGSATASKTFTLRINNLYKDPYENLYLRAFPTQDQRTLFYNIVNNQDIFPDELLYRKEDPWFGRATDLRFLEVAGVNPSSLSEYVSAIQNNHYWKRINFGEIKTAIATDEFRNTKYEVVYVEAQDPLNTKNSNVRELVDLSSTINPYIENGVSYATLYPNTLENMEARVTGSIGYSARGLLPDWMTSVQADKSVPGFTRAIVLAYTVPGASKLIAYRLKDNGIEFNQIDFTVDRYQLDNTLSQYYNTDTDQFIKSKETTFDQLTLGVGTLDGAVVDYAVSQPFDSINSRTINYINQNGGIDGVTGFSTGDLLIFAKQENYFSNTGPNDGWNDYRDLYLGNSLNDLNTDSFYDIDQYDEYSIIPGYIEKQQNILSYLLQTTTVTGTSYLYIPYTVGMDFVGKSVEAFSGIQPNTFVIAQALDTIGGSTVFKLTINKPATVDMTIGSSVVLKSAFSVGTTSSGYTLTPSSMPADLRIGCIVTGTGIPANTVVTDVTSTTVTVSNLLGTAVASGTIVSYAITNQRAGVWKIVITDNIVNLEFQQEIELGQKVKVLNGVTYGYTFLTYNPVLDVGQTIPAYTRWVQSGTTTSDYTIFDGHGTRFFDSRDSYAEPGTGDKYIKFPQIGVFT